MTKPLALLFFEKLLPGSQLMNRLEDLGYRVRTVSDPGSVVAQAIQEKPLVIFMDVEPRHLMVCNVIRDLRGHAESAHIPVIAIASERNAEAYQEARQAGATLVVADHAVLVHLEPFLNQALEV